MTSQNFDPIEIAQALIKCRSVTPEEGGALDYLQTLLSAHGFTCTRLPFAEAGTPDVDNLYARIGKAPPHICFAGHTDVVPPGNEPAWRYPPFSAQIRDGILYGRGAADMKGGIACFLAATLVHLKQSDGKIPGSISFLITGDEEGPAINGTVKLLQWLSENDEQIDHCLVGEPTNPKRVGEEIKIGRRGSLNGVLTIRGKQGHVAYPALAKNPMTGLLAVMQSFQSEALDDGNDYFEPSNLEFTSIDTGNPAENVIPEQITAMFNVRFNNLHTGNALIAKLQEKTRASLKPHALTFDLNFRISGESFLTEPGHLSDTLSKSIAEVTGNIPSLTTGGGTSDARFIKDICPVVEFGLANATIHKVDEQVPLQDLIDLTRIYRLFLEHYFSGDAARRS